MAYEICNMCGGMFKQNGNRYCDRCFKEDKEEYETLIEYIQNNPDHTILDIMKDTGLSVKSINRFIESGSVSYNKEEEYIKELRYSRSGQFHVKRRRL